MRREIEDVFIGLGFRVAEGPEVERVYYNFDALNHDAASPGAAADRHVLRRPSGVVPAHAHLADADARDGGRSRRRSTSSSPAARYRRDTDATHTPQFHQVEGLAVDEDITLGDLQGTLLAFARAVFGEDRDVRLRPHFFPFTEPSVESTSRASTARTAACATARAATSARARRWIEILGAGMVDPNVFGYVREHGYDPERIQGFAFGMGIERIAFLKHGVSDLRLMYENDLRFLEQFG